MIKPDEIYRKATNLYKELLRAWLEGESFFPRVIPCDKDVDDNLANAIESIQLLKSESKELRGYGYSIGWKEVNSRKHGRNQFPVRIVFETEDDFLQYIGKQREFSSFVSAVERTRARYPVLQSWIRSHRKLLIDSSTEVDGLLQVVDYLCTHPRPGLFARELPLVVDTKFIQRNHRILREWLDLILPPHTIRADEDHFDRRYGLRYADPHVMVRFLDDEIRRATESPWLECSVPLHTLAATPINASRVLIVENKVNLLTLPRLKGTIGLGGLGNGITDLRYVHWLANSEIWYWGDIDVEGLLILSRLRVMFPQVRSLLMDDATVHAWREHLASPGSGRIYDCPSNLTAGELAAYLLCATENLRVEQERFPQPFVDDLLARTCLSKTGQV